MRQVILFIMAIVYLSTNLLLNTYAQEDSIESSIIALGSEDSRVVKEASEYLLKEKDQALFSLIDVLDSPQANALIRYHTITILGKIGSPEATAVLVEGLNNKNSLFRREAVRALGEINDKDAIIVLDTMLAKETDPAVLNEVVIALGRMQAKGTIDKLIQIVKDSQLRSDGYGPILKGSAIEALGELKAVEAINILTGQLFIREDQLIKDKAVYALGEIGDQSTLPELEQYLKKLILGKPEDPMYIYPWKISVQLAEEAIAKIKYAQCLKPEKVGILKK